MALGRKSPPVFTREMAQSGYTILIPDMNTIHFKILQNVFNRFGYKAEVLYNAGRAVVDEGLRYVHNDTCYPALLVIGQMLDALKSGKYDPQKTALMITQTGGGCRASNYIHLLRKALEKAGFGHVPVISLNFSGMEKGSGFQLSFPILRQALAGVAYGDLLMLLDNQVRPYELNKGDSAALTERWIGEICDGFSQKNGLFLRKMGGVFERICSEFAQIPRENSPKIRVGVVGEIYIKYAPLGNNALEKFLHEQGCDVMVPGLLDFCLYCLFANIHDRRLYGGKLLKSLVSRIAYEYLCSIKKKLCTAVAAHDIFVAPSDFKHIVELAEGVIGHGCKMGEGWLLTAEMLELAELGYGNIVCVQPFGCLPNHIIAKGMSRKVKRISPAANVVAIDYDPGASKVNQENRIKLMLEMAREPTGMAAVK